MGPGNEDRRAAPAVRGGIVRQVDIDQERLDTELPGWKSWPIGTWDRRTEWSALPAGASVAVITGAPSPAALIKAVREFEADLPARLADARAERAAQPDTGIGRDRAAVIGALVAALEALATSKGTSVAES